MNLHKGIAPLVIVIIIAIVLALGGGAYVATHPEVLHMETSQSATTTDEAHVQTTPGDHPEVDHSASEGISLSATDIHWKLDKKAEKDGVPQTLVSVQVGETVHEVGTFEGSCSMIDAKGGVDGKGLLAGELSAVQCWFAGGGDEIGIFAKEDGGAEVMVGGISEPDGEGAVGTRGNFKIQTGISL